MKDEGLESEMSSYLKRYKPIKQNDWKQVKYNKEQNQWDITTNGNSIVGASVPFKTGTGSQYVVPIIN